MANTQLANETTGCYKRNSSVYLLHTIVSSHLLEDFPNRHVFLIVCWKCLEKIFVLWNKSYLRMRYFLIVTATVSWFQKSHIVYRAFLCRMNQLSKKLTNSVISSFSINLISLISAVFQKEIENYFFKGLYFYILCILYS